MDLSKLLTVYFPQLLVVLGIFGYLIKLNLESKTKKAESRHNLFQQNKLDAIKEFYRSCVICERAFRNISTVKLLTNKYSPIELDELTKEPISGLLSSQLILNLFLDDLELDIVKDIVTRIMDLHDSYQNSFMTGSEENFTIQKSNLLQSKFETMRIDNEKNLKKFGLSFQLSMNA